jgi:hypothetical protein
MGFSIAAKKRERSYERIDFSGTGPGNRVGTFI